jgi:acyl-coenzyme A thioesterase PaaI-like protein
MECCANDEKCVSAINEMLTETIPFHRVLGLKVESISYERVRVSFQMRDELMGHYQRRMLHGGAISSVIDVAGGLSAFMGVQ